MVLATLKERFGFDGFKPGQEKVVSLLTGGQSAVAVFPTGAGKSLCYQLPALTLSGLTLVVSPLLSLMKDQIDFLQNKGLPAAKVDSTMDRDALNRVLADAENGSLKILMISVERFRNELFRNRLKRMNISLLVVDEAHCISEWGHNFRPDYLKIPAYRNEYAIGQVLLLTATATPKVTIDMCAKFDIPESGVVNTGFYRENLHLNVHPATRKGKDPALLELLSRAPKGPSIVYVTLQKTAQAVADTLNRSGIRAAAYHAGLKSEAREGIQNRFMAGETEVVVATIAFGMGIDKSDVRKIVHYDLPKSLENYSQETGRAGRDGNTSLCSVLACRDNLNVLENFIYGDTPGVHGIRQVLEEIQNYDAPVWEVRINRLAMDTDIRLLPLKTLLVHLEMRGIIRPKYTYFEDYSFKYRLSPEAILDRFQGDRKAFAAAIFSSVTTKKVWSSADIDTIVAKTGSQRSRVTAALNYFDEKGWIDLNAKGSVDTYEITDRRFQPDTLADELYEFFQEREAFEIKRIHTMLAFLGSEKCLNRNLTTYFGSPIERDCGHCSVCTTGQAILPPARQSGRIAATDLGRAAEELFARLNSAPDANLVARFFCGIVTPALTKLKARKIPGFGMFENEPYQEVKEWVEQNL